MHPRRMKVVALALVCALSSTGCLAHLSMSEEREWGRLLDRGIVQEPIPFKSKGVTGFWSFVIPGVGHFYAGEPGLGVAFFLGNILWPFSPFWTLPAGLQAAEVTNKRRTVEYYKFGANAKVVESLRAKGKLSPNFKTFEQAGFNTAQ